MNSNSISFIPVQVQNNYFFEFKWGKRIEFFRVRVRSPDFNDVFNFSGRAAEKNQQTLFYEDLAIARPSLIPSSSCTDSSSLCFYE